MRAYSTIVIWNEKQSQITFTHIIIGSDQTILEEDHVDWLVEPPVGWITR